MVVDLWGVGLEGGHWLSFCFQAPLPGKGRGTRFESMSQKLTAFVRLLCSRTDLG